MDLFYQMNKIKALIDTIETHDGITRVLLTSGKNKLTAITLELPTSFKIGSEVNVIFKETEVGIAKNFKGEISFSNLLQGTILFLNKGKILSKVNIDVDGINIGSIITTNAVEQLTLGLGDEVKIFIKATEVSLEEAL